MANMPAVNKRKLSVQLWLTTIARLDKVADATGISRNALINAILDDATANVELTEEELKEIEDEIEENKKNR